VTNSKSKHQRQLSKSWTLHKTLLQSTKYPARVDKHNCTVIH